MYEYVYFNIGAIIINTYNQLINYYIITWTAPKLCSCNIASIRKAREANMLNSIVGRFEHEYFFGKVERQTNILDNVCFLNYPI